MMATAQPTPDEPRRPDLGFSYLPEQDYACAKHGPYRGQPWKLAGTKWFDAICPGCDREACERSEREARAEAERRAHVAQVAPFETAGIPLRFRSATFASYAAETRGQRHVLKVVKAYADRFADRRAVGGGLMLLGRPGTGKTHLMCALAAQLLDRWRIRYSDCWSIINAVKATYAKESRAREEQVMHFYAVPDLLLIDEIGVGHGTDADRAIIHRIIDLRYQAVKPTVVAGNVDIEELKHHLGERAVSRLFDSGGVSLSFDWDDHRRR